MPNWCTGKLTIPGKQNEIDAFIEKITKNYKNENYISRAFIDGKYWMEWIIDKNKDGELPIEEGINETKIIVIDEIDYAWGFNGYDNNHGTPRYNLINLAKSAKVDIEFLESWSSEVYSSMGGLSSGDLPSHIKI